MADLSKQQVCVTDENELSQKELYNENARIELLLEQKSNIERQLKLARRRIAAHLHVLGQDKVQIGNNIYYIAVSSYGFETTDSKIVKKHAERNLLEQFALEGKNHLMKSTISKATLWEYYQEASPEEQQKLDRTFSQHGLKFEKRTTLKSKNAPQKRQ